MTTPPPKSAGARSGLNRLSAAESKLLARLAAAGTAGLAADTAPAAAAGLVRRDLAVEQAGRLVATASGVSRAAREGAGETGYLAQHRTLETRTLATERGHERVLVDLDESPLAWLARRKGRDGKPLLAPAEVMAGEKLRAEFTRAQLSPRVTANWEAAVASGRRSGGGGVADMADSAVAARMRVERALEAVGPELSGALVDVCCFLKGLEEVERDRSWPARGAKLVLGLGLARLARHYGLVAEGERRGRIVSWGAPDSRPTIDGEPR